MRAIAITSVILCALGLAVWAEGLPETATLAPVFKSGDVTRYSVKVQVTGTTRLPGASQPTPVEATMDLVLVRRVGESDKDGLIQLSISAEQPSAVVADQKVELAKDVFPNMTALVDKSGDVKRLFAGDLAGMRLPGLNYRNLILLFHPNAPAGELKPGATWKKTACLPPEAEKYDLSYSLQGIEDVEAVPTAKVRTDVAVLPPEGSDYTAKGFAISNFSLAGAALVKSHAEMVVKMANPAPKAPSGEPASGSSGEVEAIVKVDVARIDSAAR